MRSFDYSRLYDKAWDTDILNFVAKIHECKGRQEERKGKCQIMRPETEIHARCFVKSESRVKG